MNPQVASFVFWLYFALAATSPLFFVLHAVNGSVVGAVSEVVICITFSRMALGLSRDYHRPDRRSRP